MPSASKKQLSFREWPADDRQRWEAVFKSGDLFDEADRGAHVAPSTREALRTNYARYLRFIADHHHGLLEHPPEVRLNRELIAEYVSRLRRTNQESSVVTTLRHLRLALRLICPDVDWAWMLTITKRIAAAAPRKAGKRPTVTSELLYLLGIELMDRAVATAHEHGGISKLAAMEYRDSRSRGRARRITGTKRRRCASPRHRLTAFRPPLAYDVLVCAYKALANPGGARSAIAATDNRCD
jgi:hypothetical protein